VHHIHIMKGGQEATAEVVITATGAVPPRVQMGASALKQPLKPYASGAAAGRAPPSAGTGEPATKSKPTAPSTKFE